MAKRTTAAPVPFLPKDATWKPVPGAELVELKAAAALARIHPVALSMGRELLKAPNSGGAAFTLGDARMRERSADIAKLLTRDLRRVVKRLEPAKKLKLKTHREDGRLVFWLTS